MEQSGERDMHVPGTRLSLPDKAREGLVYDDGTLEALKWLAMLLMVVDHANKWVFDASFHWMYAAGRLSAPIFVFVLAYNLARPDALQSGTFWRTAKRLALFGALSTPAFMALNNSWWPLNIMFTLLASLLIVHGLAKGTVLSITAAGIVFAASGLVVEYFYPGLLMFAAAWAYCQRPGTITLAAWAFTVALLTVINGNWWAMVSVPLLMAAGQINLHVPRIRWLFYVVYPVHLISFMPAILQ